MAEGFERDLLGTLRRGDAGLGEQRLDPGAEALLAEAGIPATERAEQVSLEAFCHLARLVAAERGG